MEGTQSHRALRMLDITGQRFANLVVGWPAGRKSTTPGSSACVWLCVCDCGSLALAVTAALRRGAKKTCADCAQRGTVTHGMSYEPEFAAYREAKYRCTNPTSAAWQDYGGRGIEFRFSSFEQFFAAIGPRPTSGHSLDRQNNSGHYELGNVRWATRSEQALNRRTKTEVLDDRR